MTSKVLGNLHQKHYWSNQMSSGSYPRDFRIPAGTFTDAGSIRTEQQIRRLLRQPFPSDQRPGGDFQNLMKQPFRPASERVPRGFQVPTIRPQPFPIPALRKALRRNAGGMAIDMAIALFERGPQFVTGVPDGTGPYGDTWQIIYCPQGITNVEYMKYDSSIYCGPLTPEMVSGYPGIAHVEYQHYGGYKRHVWSFAGYEGGFPAPYTERCHGLWSSNVWVTPNPENEWWIGEEFWPQRWYHEQTNTWWDEPTPLPEQHEGQGKYTYLFPTFKTVVPVRMHDYEPPKDPPLPSKPGPGTKEVKMKLVIKGPVRYLFDSVTELLDVLNCLYAGLPRELQLKPRWDPTRHGGQGGWRHPTPQMKAQQVYQNVNSIDWPKVFGCMVQNEIEDRLIGKVGQLTANANQLRGNLAGVAFGPAL